MHKTIFPSLALLALVLATGCQSVEMPKKVFPWSADQDAPKKSEYKSPAKMVAVWTDSVYYSAGGVPTRGFGGRLYFYDEKGQAIPVEGKLAVYGYDDTGLEGSPPPPNRPPERRFAFTAEQFTKHYSKTDLGASYSVWVPWDTAGGPQRHITLLPVFTTLDGKVTVGQQTANILPGPTNEILPADTTPQPYYEGAAVSYQEAENQSAKQMTTKTINVPRSGAIHTLNSPRTPMMQPRREESEGEVEPAASTYTPPPAWQPEYARRLSWQDPRGRNASRRPEGSQPPPESEAAPTQAGPMDSLGAHYERSRSRVLGGPISRLGRDHAPTQRFP
jgi:hypothetical protein